MTTPETLPAQRPASMELLAEAVREARHHGRYVRVAGTDSLPLRAFPADRPVQLISTARINKILEHAVGDMTVTVGAGITLDALQRELAWRNQWLPVDPPIIGMQPGSKTLRTPGSHTIGGLIASNTLGPLRFGMGDWRLFILGMRWIDAEGRVIKGGGKTVKNVAGYSTPRLMIGSCGSLGVIGEVTLRTFARPADEQSVLFFCEDAARAEALLAAVLASPTSPAYVQLIGARGFAQNPLQLPAPANGLLVVVGYLGREEICTTQVETIRRLPAAGNGETITLGPAQSGRLRQWMTTEPLPPAEGTAFRLFGSSSRAAETVRALEAVDAPFAWVVSEAGSGVVRGSIGEKTARAAVAAITERLNATPVWSYPQPSAPPGTELACRIKHAIDPNCLFGQL